MWYAHVESSKDSSTLGTNCSLRSYVWRVCLGEGGERRAHEGDETADVLRVVKCYVTAYVC